MGLRETRERVSRQFKFLKSQLGCFRTTKYILFYSVFRRNRPIETIDGYNKRSTMERFRISPDRPIVDGGLRSLLI